MDSMEKLVRFRLSQRAQDKLRDYVTKHPEIEAGFKNAHNQYEQKVMEDMRHFAEDEDEFEDLMEEMGMFLKPMMGMLKTSFTLDALISQAGTAYTRDADTVKKEFDKQISEMEDAADDDVIPDFSELKLQTSKVTEYARANDVIAARVADVAREKNIDAAITDEVIYNATREVFPTKERYLQHLEMGKETQRKILPSLTTAFSSLAEDEEEGEMISGLIGPLLNNANVYIDAMLELTEAQTKEEIGKIYGSD